MEQANSKNKTLRAAALAALAEHDRPEVVNLFSELIKGKALDILAGPFRAIRNRDVLDSLLNEGRKTFDLVLKGNEEENPRFLELLDCLKERKDEEVEDFLLNCFGQCDKLGKLKSSGKSPVPTASGADMMDRLAWLLYEISTPKSLEAVLAQRDVLPLGAFTQVLHSALRIWSAEKVYQEFSPLLDQGKGAGKHKSETLQHTIRTAYHGHLAEPFDPTDIVDESEAQKMAKLEWDPRWLDAAIKADLPITVCCLARPGHKGVISYLLKVTEGKAQFQTGLIIQALARCQYPKVTDTFLDLVAKKTKAARYFDYDLQSLLQSVRHLPVADLPNLDAFAAKLDEKFVDKYLEALEPLRPLNPPNQN
jgi:hypothetical protein